MAAKFKVGDRVNIPGGCCKGPGVALITDVGERNDYVRYYFSINGAEDLCFTKCQFSNDACADKWTLLEEPMGWHPDYIYIGEALNIAPFESLSGTTKPKQTLMQKLTSAMKRLLSPELQKQFKAGLRNGDLKLTQDAKDELLEMLAATADGAAALNKLADDRIAEDKED